ncbi:(NiFe) hydrogenase maturation protein HypF [Cyanobium sp. PCC 7001]|uniref:carbamoyltransferase HypF n=1 Tax=Cyanobium sp. PCC 7001 TaxID=180281 RepID=UPI0001804F1C|nr:carbamoyltransferase HypF [Cyanobium sp. PCC 7001]EDY37240.1 (NiFe) hydrogenase maturation protein HypF [Cyanobium sp. PCC 7001]
MSPARLLLHCRGTVQGVGFRPFVHRLARALDLVGEVENVAGAVRVDLQGERPALEQFLGRLGSELPAPARLEPLQPRWLPPLSRPPRAVRIAAAAPRPLGAGLIAQALVADRAPCPACLAELADPTDRRHGYPFISCAACGPRYSIATAEPFARAHTTLAAFPLCAACRSEFEDPADRRFHAETIGCPACGPRLQLLAAAPDTLPAGRDPIAAAADLLRAGGILALQGVGGFQLLVEATRQEAVQRLRRRKSRPAKPFALLVADPAWLEPQVRIGEAEIRLLRSPAAPIVLLRRRHDPQALQGPAAMVVAEAVAPGSPALGVMLPASPLHRLLVAAVGRPLVATSGNPSGEPLCIDPLEARQRLAGIADAFLLHNRPIARPLDDSLVQLIDGRPVLLRRARGHAPAALDLPLPPPADHAALALGGDLKAAPALARGGQIWVAPYQGDLAGARQQRAVEQGLDELLQTLGLGGAPPDGDSPVGASAPLLVADAHPGYVGTALAARLAQRYGTALQHVQHHRAHGLAVAAEHGLAGPLLVWAADGLGYGPGPGPQLWGGELLLLDGAGAAQRLACLRPWPLPGGERAMRECRRTALGLLLAADPALLHHPGAAACRGAFSPAERQLLAAAVAGGCNAPRTTALGRLFDAVASLLDVLQEQSYEGEAGLRLEGLARRRDQAAENPSLAAEEPVGALLPLVPVPPAEAPDLPLGWLDWEPLLRRLLDALAAEAAPESLASGFHHALTASLVAAAARAAELSGCRRVALAGGCFQNALLLEGCIAGLRRAGLQPCWSEQLPCNDGGLALGQLWAVLPRVSRTEAAAPAPHVPGHCGPDPGHR